VVARPVDLPYLPGHASGWLAYRHPRTVVGVIVGIIGRNAAQRSVVIAQPDSGGCLRPVAVTLPLHAPLREVLAPLLNFTGGTVTAPVYGLYGKRQVEYHPVHPEIVLEVASSPAGSDERNSRPRAVCVRTDIRPDQVAVLGR
ncbi:hypothetical protein ACFXKJ_41120, partial [Kitasatospora indigofera]